MEYVVTQSKQIAVTAETPEEAQKKVLNGEGNAISSNLSAQPRPQATTPQVSRGVTGGKLPDHMVVTPTKTITTTQPNG